MLLKPIKNELDYDDALTRVDELMEINPKIGTPGKKKKKGQVMNPSKTKK